MTSIAYAAAPAAQPQAGGLMGFVPLILIFVVFYFLLIRPQQKKAKEHQSFLNNLKKGDEIVTSGGIFGKITGMTDTVVTVEVAENVRIKMNRGSIMSSMAEVKKQAESPAKKAGG